jgi:hypothetical protein
VKCFLRTQLVRRAFTRGTPHLGATSGDSRTHCKIPRSCGTQRTAERNLAGGPHESPGLPPATPERLCRSASRTKQNTPEPFSSWAVSHVAMALLQPYGRRAHARRHVRDSPSAASRREHCESRSKSPRVAFGNPRAALPLCLSHVREGGLEPPHHGHWYLKPVASNNNNELRLIKTPPICKVRNLFRVGEGES